MKNLIQLLFPHVKWWAAFQELDNWLKLEINFGENHTCRREAYLAVRRKIEAILKSRDLYI